MNHGVRKHFRTLYKVQLADALPSDCLDRQDCKLSTVHEGGKRGRDEADTRGRWTQRAADRSGVEARPLHHHTNERTR
jgi:hypothetical protein